MVSEHCKTFRRENPGATYEDYLIRYPTRIVDTGFAMIEYEKIPLEILRIVYQHAEPSECLEICRLYPTEFINCIRDFEYTLAWIRYIWRHHREKLLFYVQNAKWDFCLKEVLADDELLDHPQCEEIRRACN